MHSNKSCLNIPQPVSSLVPEVVLLSLADDQAGRTESFVYHNVLLQAVVLLWMSFWTLFASLSSAPFKQSHTHTFITNMHEILLEKD